MRVDYKYEYNIITICIFTVNSHYFWICICKFGHSLKFMCNPKINTCRFHGHLWTCAEQ